MMKPQEIKAKIPEIKEHMENVFTKAGQLENLGSIYMDPYVEEQAVAVDILGKGRWHKLSPALRAHWNMFTHFKGVPFVVNRVFGPGIPTRGIKSPRPEH